MSAAGEALRDRVQQALAEIPHGERCDFTLAVYGGSRPCRCDREQRIAQRVTDAIDAANWTTFNETWMGDWPMSGPAPDEEASIRASARDAAVAALGGVSSPENRSTA